MHKKSCANLLTVTWCVWDTWWCYPVCCSHRPGEFLSWPRSTAYKELPSRQDGRLCI